MHFSSVRGEKRGEQDKQRAAQAKVNSSLALTISSFVQLSLLAYTPHSFIYRRDPIYDPSTASPSHPRPHILQRRDLVESISRTQKQRCIPLDLPIQVPVKRAPNAHAVNQNAEKKNSRRSLVQIIMLGEIPLLSTKETNKV